MALRAKVDPSRTLKDLDRAEKNIRFGAARGLTTIAREAQVEATRQIPGRFDRPTPFTRNAVAIKPATRDALVAYVFVKDVQAGYLLMQETGGVETPRPGHPINLPVAQRTNIYGNIPRGAIARAKRRKDTFAVGRGEKLKPGIYQRTQAGRGRARKAILRLLVAFEGRASYRPRFGFRTTVIAVVMTRGPGLLAASIAHALRTAR